ncbi:acetate--CoA ligase [Pseudonocardia ailaonensis]|uniref:Acetate--CoA ligase n=1 Tax=Pseudonocardia ailaonensis TaxID=367279 RepID=A0ABN2N4S0_9PSEU
MANMASFPGPVHLVNPSREVAFGRRTSPSLSAIGEPVDHAVLLVSARRVPDVLRDAAAAGVHHATVIASGFGEGAGAGAEVAEEAAALCAEHDIVLLGPNCYGFNNYAGTYLSRYTIDPAARPGNIALSFQSGQLGAATADAAAGRRIPLRYLVSTGNELVADTNDFLEAFLENDEVAVLGGVFERIAEPERFERLALAAIDRGKPIVALKPGRSAAASRIAVAHTGAITGSDEITDAFLADLGIVRVQSVEELAETAGLLARRGWPRGARTAFFGYSGGASELFADQAEGTSIGLPQYSEHTLASLAEATGMSSTVIHNPFDMTVDGAVHYTDIVRILAASGEYDLLVSQGQPERASDPVPEPHEASAIRKLRADNAEALFGSAAQAGVFATYLDTGDRQPGPAAAGEEPPAGAHWVFGVNGVRAISNAIDYGRLRDRTLHRDVVPDYQVAAGADELLREAAGAQSESRSKALLALYGIPVSEDLLATTADEAVAAAARLGGPVVLKVVSDDVTHKSDVGGVVVGVEGREAVARAHDTIVTDVRRAVPEAYVQGVLVSRQAHGGLEFSAGIATDDRLGPVVVAGLGGIYVETLRDVVRIRPPFSPAEAVEALRGLRSFAVLDGVRGRERSDVTALADVLARLGRLALDLRGRLTELDVNPLFVHPEGQGVLAVDALAVFATGRPDA